MDESSVPHESSQNHERRLRPTFRVFSKKSRRFFVALVVIGVVGVGMYQKLQEQFGWFSSKSWTEQQTLIAQKKDHDSARLKVDDTIYSVEVVNTTESLAQGLSGRTKIGADGMLFVLPKRGKNPFWMKEMRFPIDIVWIVDGKVVGVLQNVLPPDPRTPLAKLPLYSPARPVDWVLELPEGTVKKKKITDQSLVTILE